MNAREAFPGTGLRISPDEHQARMEALRQAKEREAREASPLEIDITEDMEREFQPERKATMALRDYENQTAGAPKPERISPFDELCSTVGHYRAVAARIAMLADKIAGATPKAVSKPDQDIRGASGLVDVVEIANENLRDIGTAIAEDLQRIEARL